MFLLTGKSGILSQAMRLCTERQRYGCMGTKPLSSPFPTDIGRIIVEYAALMDRSTAFALSYTSKDISRWTRAILFRSLRVKHYNDWAPFIAWLRGHPAHATTAETLTVHSSPRSDGLDTALTLLPCLTTLILVVGLPWNYTLPASSSIVHLQLPDQGHPTRRQIPSDVTHVALNELCGGVTSRHLQKWLTTGALSLTSLTHLSLNFFFDSKDGISAWPSFPQFAGTISGWLPATCRVCILTTRSASTLYMCTGEMMPWVCGKRDDRLVFASHLARGHSIPRGPGLDWTRFILVWKEKEIRFDGPHGHWADAVAIQDERRQWTLDAI